MQVPEERRFAVNFLKGHLLTFCCSHFWHMYISSIDGDIDFVYKLNKKDLVDLKQNFAVASKRYADSQESYRLVNRFNVKIEIDQYELSEVIEARVVDILKTVKIKAAKWRLFIPVPESFCTRKMFPIRFR